MSERRCSFCDRPLVRTDKGDYEAWGCYCPESDMGSCEVIVPVPVTRPVTLLAVVEALRNELPRYIDSGTCRFCGMDLFDDGKTLDTHKPKCIWVMAQNAK